MVLLQTLADQMLLDSLLGELGRCCQRYEILVHWQQGEFHHDLVIKAEGLGELLGEVLVVSTNCNGGVKEVLCLRDVPDRWALWRWRCPDNPEFEGELGPVIGCARTSHYFDPCELLKPDARSELRPEFRRRQRGGGWAPTWTSDDPEPPSGGGCGRR